MKFKAFCETATKEQLVFLFQDVRSTAKRMKDNEEQRRTVWMTLSTEYLDRVINAEDHVILEALLKTNPLMEERPFGHTLAFLGNTFGPLRDLSVQIKEDGEGRQYDPD